MKRLFLLGLLLFSGIVFSQNNHEFSTVYPERTNWNVQGKVLYADYADSEKGRFKKVVRYKYEPINCTNVWTVEYPKQRIKYIIRVNGNKSLITKYRI
jgi:hypothetical protein